MRFIYQRIIVLGSSTIPYLPTQKLLYQITVGEFLYGIFLK